MTSHPHYTTGEPCNCGFAKHVPPEKKPKETETEFKWEVPKTPEIHLIDPERFG